MALVILGGAKRIGAVAEYLIPVMSLGYIALSLGVLLRNAGGSTRCASIYFCRRFFPKSLHRWRSGVGFFTLRIGVSRGVFTNEAGMGTASIAHGSQHPPPGGAGALRHF